MHHIISSISTLIPVSILALAPGRAMAHWGHLADLGGHAHVAGAVFGALAATLAAGLLATRNKDKGGIGGDDAPAQDNDAAAGITDDLAGDQAGDQAHA